MKDGSFLAGYYQGQALNAVVGIGRSKEFILLDDLLWSGSGVEAEQFQDESFDSASVSGT